MPLISIGIKLSVGSTVGFTGVIAALLMQGQYLIAIPILFSIMIGLLIRLANSA
jgi:ribose/xylose/arabinose/galactoside ABC-type transport system permease subunit